MLATINKLREISERCQTKKPLGDDQLRWLGESLSIFLSHQCRTMDEAFGLRSARGGIPWWLEEALRKRDAALRELARQRFAESAVNAQARRIRVLSLRYGTSAWQFDKTNMWMPDRYIGTVKEHLWRAYASGAPMPICERQLRHILRRAARGIARDVAGRQASAENSMERHATI